MLLPDYFGLFTRKTMVSFATLFAFPSLTSLDHGLRRAALWLGLGAMALLSACGGGSGGGGADAPLPELPTLTITSDAGEVASEAFKLRLAFSAPVVFGGGAFAYCDSSNGKNLCSIIAKTPTAVDGVANTYTIDVVPNPQKNDLATIKVPAGAFKDATGRVSNSVAYEFPQYINTIGPKATFAPNSAGGVILGPMNVTLTFDSILDTALTKDQLLVSDGTISAFQRTSAPGVNDVYQFVYTPPAAIGGSVTIILPAGSVSAGGIKNGDLRQWGPYTPVAKP